MPGERCSVCEATVPFADTVHVLVHTRSDAGVVDHYVCRTCYEESLAPLFDPEKTAQGESNGAG